MAPVTASVTIDMMVGTLIEVFDVPIHIAYLISSHNMLIPSFDIDSFLF